MSSCLKNLREDNNSGEVISANRAPEKLFSKNESTKVITQIEGTHKSTDNIDGSHSMEHERTSSLKGISSQ